MEHKRQKRGSSLSNKTIDSLCFGRGLIDDVLRSIQLNTKLRQVKVSQNQERPLNFRLDVVIDKLVIHMADIASMGDKYLVWFDPKLEDYKGNDFYENFINPTYLELKNLFLGYAPKKVQDYIERTSSQHSL